jgi:serine/threonine protein kinase/tetratricopeptide (TPR) repeat protein
MTAHNGTNGTPAPAFAEGSVLAGRFRIVRFLAQGGMGEVYEAEDLELRTAVALKTIRPEIAAEEHAIERFRREILLARKVTHPNVCRIFDVFHHRERGPEGQETEVVFLSMELLPGETLAARLRARGRMTTAEALPIALQLAAALSAAHRAGIVHRDFKSPNVVLVPGEEGLRAVITDFGLARAQAGSESSSSSITGSGGMVGTSAYMAPEQVEGGEINSAADIYALGVVLYEMVTGTKPFVGDSPITTALKRLTEPPPSPRALVPDLSGAWETTILRCLTRDPSRRLAAVDIAPALRGEASSVRSAPPPRRRRLTPAAVAMAILLPSSMGYLAASRKDHRLLAPPIPTPDARARRSVALVGFKNLSGRPDTAWISTALSEMLGSEVAAGESLRTIPGENIARMRSDLSLADTDSLSRDTLAQVRTHLGTDLVILGSYLDLGPQSGGRLRLDVRIQDAVAGETVASLVETGTEADLFELISRMGVRLRERLGVDLSATQAGLLAAALPSGPEAERLYAEGLARLRVFDALGARDLLEKAVAIDPGYALAHAALGEAWASLGYTARGLEQAKSAFDLAGRLPREQRLWIEARYRQAAHEWTKAVEIYGQLATSVPDNLEYRLRRAAVLTSAGDVEEALATIAAMRRLPLAATEALRIDLVEADVYVMRSDFKRLQATASRAAEKAAQQGARLLLASARFDEGWALQNLGDHGQALRAFEESRQLYERAGDRGNAAWALTYLGVSRWRQGDITAAARMYEEALAIFREIGNQRGTAAASNTIALMRMKQGRLAEARRLWEGTLAGFRAIGDRRSVSLVLNNLASVVMLEGDLPQATSMYEESLAIAHEIGEKGIVAVTLSNMGDLARERGDLGHALRMYDEALAINQEIGQRSNVALGLRNIAEVMVAQGRLAEARSRVEQQVEILKELGEGLRAPESRIAAARLALEEGRFAEAEGVTREALEAFAKNESADEEAKAWAVLAQSLVPQGKRPEALEAVTRATALSQKSRDPLVRLTVAITASRLRADSRTPSDVREALRTLESARAEARRAGRVGLRFEAELALGEIELASGRSAAARARLEQLERDARTRGFGLVAGKAARARLAGAPL